MPPCTVDQSFTPEPIITQSWLHELKSLCLRGAKMRHVVAACVVHLQDQELLVLVCKMQCNRLITTQRMGKH